MKVVLDKSRCDGCGRCVKICHKGPKIFDMKKKEIKDMTLCNACMLCVSVCPHHAVHTMR
ncbi:MAG: 4Fe-4S binding protein [Theionarchaea archaeon]|nr:4Fe-4S binding protein [Theionarchaea archaeon]